MKPPALPSIRRRINASVWWASLLGGAVLAATVWVVVAHEVDELMDEGLSEAASLIHSVMVQLPTVVALPVPTSGHKEGHLVWQVLEQDSGRVRLRSAKAPALAIVKSASNIPVFSQDHLWHVVGFPLPQSDPPQLLLVAQSEAERSDVFADVFGYTLAGVWLVFGALIFLLNRRLRQELLPLVRFSQLVQAYDPVGSLAPPPQPSRAELQPMAQAVADLGQRLAQHIHSERAFSAHAAHALRTPLAGMEAQLAVTMQTAPPAILPRLMQLRRASQQLGRVVQALLGMFRSNEAPQLAPMDWSHCLQNIPLDQALTVHLNQPSESPRSVMHADADLFAAVLMNLLDNAQRYGASQVVIDATQHTGANRLRLQDNGPGCDAATLARLRRSLSSASPATADLTGLGLALADVVLRAHGGRVQLPEVDEGFCVELQWPERGEPG